MIPESGRHLNSVKRNTEDVGAPTRYNMENIFTFQHEAAVAVQIHFYIARKSSYLNIYINFKFCEKFR